MQYPFDPVRRPGENHNIRAMSLLLSIAFILIFLFSAQGQTTSSSTPAQIALKDWIPLAATVVAALIAGLFALSQQRRASSAQRELERQKLQGARREAEISEERALAAKFRQSQVLPFLEKLDESLIKSFAVVQIPEFFPDVSASAPQVRWHSDQTISEWSIAMKEMSEHRMQLLLALDPERIPAVVSLLTKLIDQVREIVAMRHSFWFRKVTTSELRAVQHEYVSTGYRLMIEIKEAIMASPRTFQPLEGEEKQRLANELAVSFEKGGVVSVPYGSIEDFSWVAIWQIDTRPEWQQFEQNVTHSTVEEFEEAIKELAHRLYEQKDVVDLQLSMVNADEVRVFCMAVKLPGVERLRIFEESDLPNYRCEFKILWSSHRAPIEFTTGRKMGASQSKPANALEPGPDAAQSEGETL